MWLYEKAQDLCIQHSNDTWALNPFLLGMVSKFLGCPRLCQSSASSQRKTPIGPTGKDGLFLGDLELRKRPRDLILVRFVFFSVQVPTVPEGFGLPVSVLSQKNLTLSFLSVS